MKLMLTPRTSKTMSHLVVSDHSCAHQVQSVCFNGGVCVDGDPLTCDCSAVDFDGDFCENGEFCHRPQFFA